VTRGTPTVPPRIVKNDKWNRAYAAQWSRHNCRVNYQKEGKMSGGGCYVPTDHLPGVSWWTQSWGVHTEERPEKLGVSRFALSGWVRGGGFTAAEIDGMTK